MTIRRSVSKLPSGRWRGRWFDGTKWHPAGTFGTRREANAALDVQLVAEATEMKPVGGDITFHTYAQTKFFPFEDLAEKTAADQPSIYKHYVRPKWGDVPLKDINIEDVETWARIELPAVRSFRYPDRVIGDATRRQAYWMFHKIIAKAVERSYIVRSPLPRKSGIKKQQPRKSERILEPAEIELLAAAAGAWSPVVFTLGYGGFRLGEAFALRRDDLDFNSCNIAVDEKVIEIKGRLTYSKDLKRSRSHRSVPMPSVVMEMLAALTMRMEPDDLVFGAVYPNNWRKRYFIPAVGLAGLPHMTPHDMRHTAASLWFDQGFDLVDVARMLGDSLDVAEQTYVHIYKGRRPERMGALDERIRAGRAAASNVVPIRRVK